MQVWLVSSQLLQQELESDISLQRGENHEAHSEFLCNRISLACFFLRMVTAKQVNFDSVAPIQGIGNQWYDCTET